jgi:hypothetical protein
MLGRWRPFGTLLLKPGRLVGSTCDLPAGAAAAGQARLRAHVLGARLGVTRNGEDTPLPRRRACYSSVKSH